MSDQLQKVKRFVFILFWLPTLAIHGNSVEDEFQGNKKKKPFFLVGEAKMHAIKYIHTYIHTHIYIYIYIYDIERNNTKFN